jgi:hypothetical protein
MAGGETTTIVLADTSVLSVFESSAASRQADLRVGLPGREEFQPVRHLLRGDGRCEPE